MCDYLDMIKTDMTRNRRVGTMLAALSATALALAACGETEEPVKNAVGTADPTSTMASDPNATPANEIKGAELAKGTFAALKSAPAGTKSVTGVAYLAQHDKGTTVTIDVKGLQPDTAYMSHLHEQPCAKDEGGDHFQFDAKGPEAPPNEIHIAFTADADGAATTTVSNDNPKTKGAKSIVLHLEDKDGTKFACADF
ncbi:MAG: superoxide dismutase family protein [Actinophytocola sp.]|nr:superoxide dismutase family protein [Actinophytocola sp.]